MSRTRPPHPSGAAATTVPRPVTNADVRNKVKRARERNAKAARESRERKRERVQGLEGRVDALEAENAELRRIVWEFLPRLERHVTVCAGACMAVPAETPRSGSPQELLGAPHRAAEGLLRGGDPTIG